MLSVRAPAVAGLFYPPDASALSGDIREFLDLAGSDRLAAGFPKIVIAPHAGFMYSGAVAAHAYDLLRPARGIVRRVVVLGPCHRVPVRGMALPGVSAFDTPLGRIPIDLAAVQSVRDLPQVVEMPEAHRQEHAIEVQLPFLQHVLGSFSLVPFVVGRAAPEQVAEVLERLLGAEETLVVISSDLSHYLGYEVAGRMDGNTARAIVNCDPSIDHEQACGATPIAGALLLATRKSLRPRLLDLRNSGDTAGGKSRVVGYGAFAFGGEQPYGEGHGRQLLDIARRSIAVALDASVALPNGAQGWMQEQRASFVTLKLGGRLRGCIGSLEASRPLMDDVAANARAAALEDPRFPALSMQELQQSEIEVSLLSRPARIVFEDHADLIRQLVPGEDGVILEYDGALGRRRGTFLPQVWADLADPEQFVSQLKMKAGLSADTRTTRCTIKRYRVLKWRESQFAPDA